MTEPLTISNEPPDYPGMNFALLRQEGIKHIERLAGTIWTDYNTHDPGITILEALCYGITDLSYRLSFPIADLLAPAPPHSEDNKQPFFTAREILTVNPLTINDYRKLLIDIDGVKNAWLEPIHDPSPILYFNPARYSLTFESPDLPEFVKSYSEQVKMNGLYRVLIETEPQQNSFFVKQDVKSKLHQHRNLCEDFAQIEILPVEEITVNAEIEVEAGFDLNELIAKIYFELDNFISPSIQFFTLKQRLEQGKKTEENFDGVPLNHGFIDDEELQRFGRRDELHTSDLIHIILDIEGTKTIRSITIASDQLPEPEVWALDLGINTAPKLKDISETINDIIFYKGQIACQINLEKVQEKLKRLQQERQKTPSVTENKDLPIPLGQYRDLSEYESIQNEFPGNYGIGESGLPASVSTQRQAQAKQLQAYLMFFDQLLANYFAQLDHVKDLFSYHKLDPKTYVSQILTDFPGAANILTQYPQASPADQEIDLDRRNRFLDRLIAQYCENFTDYSLLLYESILEEKLIQDKVDFLQDYPQISSQRGQAFNYTDANQIWDTDNVSGLKRRISRFLGIPHTRQTLAGSNGIEGFHLIEHILLRPTSRSGSSDTAQGLTFARSISQFAPSTQVNQTEHVTCSSANHGLKDGDEIQLFDAGDYNGSYSVTNVQPETFDIPSTFVEQDSGKWVSLNQHRDPYSFQISCVFPDWLPRFQQPTFRQLVQELLISETPAHITVYCHWFNQEKMQKFEAAYHQWLQLMADEGASPAGLQATVNELLELLNLGSAEFVSDQIPKVIGYMVIEGDDNTIFTVI